LIRKILFPKKTIDLILEDAEKWKPRETGGVGIGYLFHDTAITTDFIDGGKNAVRSEAYFEKDHDYVQQKANEIASKDSSKKYLFDWHSHPWAENPQPSQGDKKEMRDTKQDDKWKNQIILIVGKNAFSVWDLDSTKDEFVEVPYQVISKDVSPDLFDRISKVIQHEKLMAKSILIIGCGSGASIVTRFLGCTGIGTFHLLDNEQLELVNVIRHEGTIEEIGEFKTEILKRRIESHNPFAVVQTHNFDALKESDRLAQLVEKVDLVISCVGAVGVNSVINKLCLEKGKMALYGGVSKGAKVGFTLVVKPKETCCYGCVFDLVPESYYVDRQTALDYGLNLDELHAAQGLWIDVAMQAVPMAEVALMVLQDEFDYKKGNLIHVTPKSFELRWELVKRKDDCPACNHSNWLKTQLEKTGIELDKTFDFRKISKKPRNDAKTTKEDE